MSIMNASKGDISEACLFIIYALLFDAVDGLAARLTRSSSRFGVELDSLSDVISFGVAPSFILYSVYLHELGDAGVLLSSLVMVFAAIRLARFNVQLVGFDKDKFNGLPAPMASFTICTYLLFYHNKILSEEISRAVLLILSVLLPVLMVSRIKYDSLPKPSFEAVKKNPIIFIILLIAVILTIVTNGEGAFTFCIFYIFTGIIRGTKNLFFRKHKVLEDELAEEPLELKESNR
jgi:CDP-diacylglycerol--serine O-phosphatidyltransferase